MCSLRASATTRGSAVGPVHVGVDLARLAPRAAASATAVVSDPPRPRVVTSREVETPLEPGHDHHVPLAQGVADPPGSHVEDARLAVQGVGDDPRLRPGERLGRHPQVGDGHGQQRHGDALPRRQQHVHLPRRRVGGDPPGQRDQVVGAVPHGRDHHHHVVPGQPGRDHALGDTPDPGGIPADVPRTSGRPVPWSSSQAGSRRAGPAYQPPAPPLPPMRNRNRVATRKGVGAVDNALAARSPSATLPLSARSCCPQSRRPLSKRPDRGPGFPCQRSAVPPCWSYFGRRSV